MYALIKGIGPDGLSYAAVVSCKDVNEVRRELIECMGINAHSLKVFINELLEIGFDVYTNIEPDNLPIVEIPINLNYNSDIF